MPAKEADIESSWQASQEARESPVQQAYLDSQATQVMRACLLSLHWSSMLPHPGMYVASLGVDMIIKSFAGATGATGLIGMLCRLQPPSHFMTATKITSVDVLQYVLPSSHVMTIFIVWQRVRVITPPCRL